MTAAPLVSVCIPAYARPRELEEGIRSVLGQGVDDVEILVGDDSGTLGPVVEAIGDPRVVHRPNPVRLGMAGNWTATLDAARGRYLALLMDDDRLLPGFLDATVAALDADPEVGIAFTNHTWDDGASETPRRCPVPAGRHDDALELLLEHLPVAVSGALMRRDVWEQARPLPDLLSADVVLHVRAALAGWAFTYVDEPLMAYRVHDAQQSGGARMRLDRVAVWELFTFADERCEALRRHHLAEALASRAALYVKQGRMAQACDDLRRARELDRRVIGPRQRAMGVLAEHPRLVPPVLGAARRLRLVRPA